MIEKGNINMKYKASRVHKTVLKHAACDLFVVSSYKDTDPRLAAQL